MSSSTVSNNYMYIKHKGASFDRIFNNDKEVKINHGRDFLNEI